MAEVLSLAKRQCIRIRIHWFQIRIQHFRLNTYPDPGFWWPKIVKNLIFVWSKIAIYLFLGLHKVRLSYLQKKPSALKREHPAFSKHEISYFCGSFLPFWIQIRIPNPNPDTDPWPDWIRDPIRIRNTANKEHFFQASAWKDGIALTREAEVPSQIQRKEAKCGMKKILFLWSRSELSWIWKCRHWLVVIWLVPTFIRLFWPFLVIQGGYKEKSFVLADQ